MLIYQIINNAIKETYKYKKLMKHGYLAQKLMAKLSIIDLRKYLFMETSMILQFRC